VTVGIYAMPLIKMGDSAKNDYEMLYYWYRWNENILWKVEITLVAYTIFPSNSADHSIIIYHICLHLQSLGVQLCVFWWFWRLREDPIHVYHQSFTGCWKTGSLPLYRSSWHFLNPGTASNGAEVRRLKFSVKFLEKLSDSLF
jgi:hypothetical protein